MTRTHKPACTILFAAGFFALATVLARTASGIDPALLSRLERRCPGEDVSRLLMGTPRILQEERGVSTSSTDLARALDKLTSGPVRFGNCSDTLALIGTLMPQGMTAEDTATGILQMGALLLAPTPESGPQLPQAPVRKHAAEKPGKYTRGSTAFLDSEFGFRGLTFGMPLSAAASKGLVVTQDNGDTKMCVRSNDDLTIGRSTLQAIYYAFYKGTLFEIVLFASGAANSGALLDYVRATYGEGQFDTEKKGYAWAGNSVHAYYEQVPGTEDAKFYLWSDRYKPPEKRAARRAEPDFPSGKTVAPWEEGRTLLCGPDGCKDVTKELTGSPPPQVREIKRGQAYIEEHPELSQAVRDAIETGNTVVGMSREEVFASFGAPMDVWKSETSSGLVETWKYGIGPEGASADSLLVVPDRVSQANLFGKPMFLTFVKGVLVSWERPLD